MVHLYDSAVRRMNGTLPHTHAYYSLFISIVSLFAQIHTAIAFILYTHQASKVSLS